MLNEFRTQEITWDKATNQIREAIRASAGDSNGRKLRVQVLNRNSVVNLTGVSLSLAWQTRDGANYGLDAFTAVDASRGIFEIYYTTEMLAHVGKLRASLVLVDTVGRIETDEFVINNNQSLVNDDAVQGENSFTALTQALVEVNYWDTRIDVVEQIMQTVRRELDMNYINVTSPPIGLTPLVGDGVTDDTEALQSLIDYAGARGLNLLFPGRTYMITSVYLVPGMVLSGYGAIIKRPAMLGNWYRTFLVPESGDYRWGSVDDSELLVLRGISFDGNLLEQGEYAGYEQQQSPLLFLSGNPETPGRLRVNIEDCDFNGSVSDGISIHTNVDVRISNSRSKDCFRGGLTVTGGHSIIQVTNFTTEDEHTGSGLDVEVDSTGYGGTLRIEMTVDGMILDSDFDVMIKDGSTFLGTNIYCKKEPFIVDAIKSRVRISNSVFHVGNTDSLSSTILHPHDVTISDTTFVADDLTPAEDGEIKDVASLAVRMNTGLTEEEDLELNLVNCTFRRGTILNESSVVHGIYAWGTSANPEGENYLNIVGCNFGDDLDRSVRVHYGIKNVLVKDSILDSPQALNIMNTENEPMRLTLDNNTIGKNVETYMFFGNAPANLEVIHRNTEMDNLHNVFDSDYGYEYNIVYTGSRTIYGDEDPITADAPGLYGDIYKLNTPVMDSAVEWISLLGQQSQQIWEEYHWLGARPEEPLPEDEPIVEE